MLEERYVTYDQAVKLRQCGFPQKPIGGFSGYRDWKDDLGCTRCDPFLTSVHLNEGCYSVAAPSYGLVMKWLIEEKYIQIRPDFDKNGWSCDVYRFSHSLTIDESFDVHGHIHERYCVPGRFFNCDDAVAKAIDVALDVIAKNLQCFLPIIAPFGTDFVPFFENGVIGDGKKDFAFYMTLEDVKREMRNCIDIIINNVYDRQMDLHLLKYRIPFDSQIRKNDDLTKVYLSRHADYVEEIPVRGHYHGIPVLDADDLKRLDGPRTRHNFFEI